MRIQDNSAVGLYLRTLGFRQLSQQSGLRDFRFAHLTKLTRAINPAHLAAPAVGADNASALLVTTGENSERLGRRAPFATQCVAHRSKSLSRKHVRRCLNRSGEQGGE